MNGPRHIARRLDAARRNEYIDALAEEGERVSVRRRVVNAFRKSKRALPTKRELSHLVRVWMRREEQG